MFLCSVNVFPVGVCIRVCVCVCMGSICMCMVFVCVCMECVCIGMVCMCLYILGIYVCMYSVWGLCVCV